MKKKTLPHTHHQENEKDRQNCILGKKIDANVNPHARCANRNNCISHFSVYRKQCYSQFFQPIFTLENWNYCYYSNENNKKERKKETIHTAVFISCVKNVSTTQIKIKRNVHLLNVGSIKCHTVTVAFIHQKYNFRY